MSLATGTKLGPYEILAALGAGGMGEVYRARDTRLGREVAIKVLPEGFAEDPERHARFEREAKLLASLNHPNVATLHALEDVGGTHFLAMELVEGEGLDVRIARGAIPIEEALPIGLQIAEGLEAAHERGIVHRDLKPGNVKVRPDGTVKVLDFGLAKAWEEQGSTSDLGLSPTITGHHTRAGVILGTAAYMSPEQARGKPVDKRADIWAFGCLLYEMLTGTRLFARETISDTLAAVLRQEVDWAALPAGLPPSIRAFLARCLERDSKRRLRDIGEARIALEALISRGTDEYDPEVGRSRRVRRSSARFVLSVAAGSVAAAALLGAALVGWLRRPEIAEPVRIRALTYSGSDSDPAASPDGKLVAFTSKRDGVSRIWIRQLVGGGEAPLTSGPDGRARFSPDGASLLFVRDLGTTQGVYRTGLVGGEPRRLVDNATAADWSPDGSRIVFVRNRADSAESSQLGILEVATGRETVVAELRNQLLISPRWSPDGNTIAFASGRWAAEDWTIQTVELATGRIAPVPPGLPEVAIGGLAWSGVGKTLFYVQSTAMMGDQSGGGNRVIRCDVASGERRSVFWADGLSSMNSSAGTISQTDVLAPGRLIFGQRLRRQNLREVELATPGRNSVSRLLAEGSSIDRQPTYSPDGKQILFSSSRGGNLDLWTIDLASRALRQVTDDAAQDWDPAYMPDGRQILWSSNRGGASYEVWLANADGSGARQVTRDGVSAQNPTATADGSWIVYWSSNAEQAGIWKIRPDGAAATRLLEASATATDVSPDGRYLLFADHQDRSNLRSSIRFLEVESGRVVPFTIDVRYSLGAPAIIWGRARWSRDGRAIYFVGGNEQGLSGVFEQEFAPGRDTTAMRRPVAGFSPEFVTESLGLSPDGSRLTLSIGQESASIMVADGVPGALPPARKLP